jgi:hypothetical protein
MRDQACGILARKLKRRGADIAMPDAQYCCPLFVVPGHLQPPIVRSAIDKPLSVRS